MSSAASTDHARTVLCSVRIQSGNNTQTYTLRKLTDPNDPTVIRRYNLTRLHPETCCGEMVYTCTLFDDGSLDCTCPGAKKATAYCKHVGALVALGILNNGDLLLGRQRQLEFECERDRTEDERRKLLAERTELLAIRADLRAAIDALKFKPRNRFSWSPEDLEPAA